MVVCPEAGGRFLSSYAAYTTRLKRVSYLSNMKMVTVSLSNTAKHLLKEIVTSYK